VSAPRALVTGGTGFIGRQVLPGLVDRGFEVHALTSRSSVDWPAGVTGHRVDLLDVAAARKEVARIGATHLVHLAWDVTPATYVTSLDNLDWVGATLALFRAFAEAGGRRVIGAGTSAEYDWSAGRCAEALTQLRPATLYAVCKRSVSAVLEGLAEQLGFEWAWGRVFFLYGPGEPAGRLLPSIIEGELNGEPLVLRHPRRVRDYLHVADVGAAFAALAASAVRGPVNIASGEGVALADLAGLVRQALELPPLPPLPEGAPDPLPTVIADVARLRQEVGFSPRFQVKDGIFETVAWWKSQRTRTKVEA
jgi:nucleoside-diphosphate-sugar epimerase